MAIIENNILLHGISGKLGNVVFRQLNGKTIMCLPPQRRAAPTAIQKEQRERFRLATMYAKMALDDPDLKYMYEKAAKKLKSTSAYAAAVADYLKRPEIEEITTGVDTGSKEAFIFITSASKGKNLSVCVTIFSANGKVIEAGYVNCDGFQRDFKYVVQRANSLSVGNLVEVKVTDMPGNIAVKTVVID
ncbi:hypothetical protein [Chryseolinea sp. H1M3-3]|uniref:hypothetical protein n=1 Tax=Chryseolinea sp. H1M3-3 TaxID=3034144 RepID=UPI0023EB9ACF|nr:hypothetical protein [Chryseolinea sp. H1M3-3]